MSKADRTSNISDIINKRRNNLAIKKGYLSLFGRIILLGAIGYLLFTQVFLLTQASGIDMFPSIKDGDLVVGFRLQQEYAKNDVVVYQAEGSLHLGRIAARPTDIVVLDDSGTLLVNGTVQEGEILYLTYAKEGIVYPYRVPNEHIFVLGDYRTQARDSRDFGPIPMNSVKGKVITILRRRGL